MVHFAFSPFQIDISFLIFHRWHRRCRRKCVVVATKNARAEKKITNTNTHTCHVLSPVNYIRKTDGQNCELTKRHAIELIELRNRFEFVCNARKKRKGKNDVSIDDK